MKEIMALIVSGGLALIFAGLGLPLFLGKIRRNYFYGFVVSQYALLDDDIWYEVNRLGGKNLLIIGVLLALNSLFALLFFGKITVQGPILYVDLAIIAVGFIYSLIKGRALNNQLAKEKGLKNHIQPQNAYKTKN